MGLVQIAQDPNTSPELRGKVLSDLMQYLYPKRRSQELSAADGQQLEIIVSYAGHKRDKEED